ncbi:S9 family peptidase [Aliidiomarina celeris]|uniref:S9 family peptidase n=1 Tax=Aliidiomarina celeris TaxID=2249428 RepID=UPI000DEA8F80|nr:S9 family peptidase [Aliidiomarina celeris]
MKARYIATMALVSGLVLSACQTTAPPAAHSRNTNALPSDTTFTLTDLYTDRYFATASLPATRWLADGSGYTTLESNTQGGRDIVRYHPQTQARTVLVSAAQLTPEGQDSALTIADYQWSDNGNKVLIFTNTVRSWRTHTLGDYWVLDRTTNQLTQLGAFAPESTLQFAKFDPSGERVAYVMQNNIYVESLTNNSITQLTHDGGENLINGTFDWVNEEEFGLRDGFRWSPNGEFIAYWQVDTSGVKRFTMIDNTSELYPTTTSFPYPKVGETNSALRVGVLPVTEGAETTWVKLEGDPRQHYIVRMEWAGNSDKLMLQHMNRAQNTMHFMLADRETGNAQRLLTEQSNAWVEQVDNVRFFRNGQSFTWQSERSGFRHLYRYNADAAESSERLIALTEGDYDVIELLEIVANAQGEGYAYFIASPESPLQRYLFRVDLSGTSAPERLTPTDWNGSHSYQIAKDGNYAIHTFSRFGVPPETRMVSLPNHEVIQTLELNTELKSRIAEKVTHNAEFFQVTARDGLELDGYVMRPGNFDPNKKYPLIMFVYGEPWGQTVADRWLGHLWLWHEYMTQLGYVVVSVDNRGTRSPRGQAWRHSIYKQLGIVTVRDQADALTELAERWDWIDSDRVGIWGHSGGGSQTLNALFRYPELFHVGIASAPVPDLRLYDTIYQERYSGLLPEDADSYEETSAVTHAHNLQGQLLLIHGTGDDNVHYQGSERLQNELIRHQKQFTFMAYPNRSHSISEGEGTVEHFRTLKALFFWQHLPVTDSQ